MNVKQAFRAIHGTARAELRREGLNGQRHMKEAFDFDDEATDLVAQWTGLPRVAPGLCAYTVARTARRVAEDNFGGI